MLNAMLSYSTEMLGAISQFLSSEPMIYVVGLIAVAVAIKIFCHILGRA